MLGALGFPEDGAADLAAGADDPLHHVSAELALGDRFDEVERKTAAQQVLQVQFLHLALQLLRTLLGAAFEFLDLFLHRRDGLFLLRNPETLFLLGFLARLLACLG